MPRCTVLLALGGLFFSVAAIRAADPQGSSPVKALLGREIVGSTLPLSEVERYCEARVPRMPEVKSAAEWQAEANRLRAEVLAKVVFRGEAAKWRDAATRIQWLDTISGGSGYRIKKLRYEALPNVWIPALLYEPEKLSGNVPVILNVNGHVGAPGKSVPYKQIRCINQAKRGMLALNVEWFGMGQLDAPGFAHSRMNQIDLCGTSSIAVHYLYLKRGLDLLLGLPNADPKRVAVTGLSGGGWQTAFIAGLDPRVTLANPVAGYSSFRTRAVEPSDLGDSEQTPNDLGMVADYCHLTAMRAPNPTLITMNAKDDCCFAAGHSLPPLLDAAKPIYKLFGREDALRWHVNENPGTHNYDQDNREAFYRMIGDFFAESPKDFNAKEIPSDGEVKPKTQLDVPLPEKQENFHSLAVALSKDLPRNADWPKEPAALAQWQKQGRANLREIVRAKDYQVHAIKFDTAEQGGVKATLWKLQMSGAWTVPVVELVKGEAKKTAILVADGGRTSAADQANRLLEAGYRVLAMDPFYFGESRIPQRSFLYALLVAGIGDRPLGIQASQVAAAARWSQAEHKTGPVRLVAVGPRLSTVALIAAALEEKAIGAVELHQPLKSLKQVIEQDTTVEQTPELFCFGLLEHFDMRQLTALVTPRPVDSHGVSAELIRKR